MSFRPPAPERVSIPGPAGPLQAVVEAAPDAVTTRFGVICHPHPLYGGTLDNKVVHTLARAFQQLGVPTIRFNFRGVGQSAGSYDEGGGETEDALAAVAYGRSRWPDAHPWLAGFSFGAAMAIRIAAAAKAERLVTVAPPVTRFGLDGSAAPRCPWLLVQGDADELVEPREVLDWAAQLSPAPTMRILPGASHFFHGRLHELREVVIAWAGGKEKPGGPQGAPGSS